jgi:transposase
VNLSLTRLYGRAPRGERVVGSAPQNYGSNTTLVGVLGIEGVEAAASFEGATDGITFRTFVEKLLAPSLSSGDVVVMDNLAAHKVKGIREAIESRGATLIYLPPYSPDFSPIEQCWSKVKTFLRAIGARTRDKLNEGVGQAFDLVTQADSRGWFSHCGYAVHQP